MRALFAGLQPQHRPGTYECFVDLRGVRHVVPAGDPNHAPTARCRCNPNVLRVIEDDSRDFLCWTITHRRMRNSRALYQPWERGH